MVLGLDGLEIGRWRLVVSARLGGGGNTCDYDGPLTTPHFFSLFVGANHPFIYW